MGSPDGLQTGFDNFNLNLLKRLSLAFDFRAVELDLGLDLRGTDFLSSFSARGLGVHLGMRFGY